MLRSGSGVVQFASACRASLPCLDVGSEASGKQDEGFRLLQAHNREKKNLQS